MDQDALDASPVFQVEPESVEPESHAEWLGDEAFDDEARAVEGLEDGALTDDDAMDLADADALLAEVEGVGDQPRVHRSPRTPRPAARQAVDARSIAGWIWTGLGAAATAAGATGIWLTLSNSTALEATMAVMERMGLAPIHLLALGALLLGLGSAARRQRRLHGYIAQLNAGQDLIGSIVSSVQAATRALQDAETRRNEQPASSEDMNFMRFELQRYDEKIVNLTKAMRSFGAPVMEISKQLGDTAHLLSQQKASLDELRGATEARHAALDAALREGIESIAELTRSTTDRVTTEVRGTRGSVDERVGKLEGELQARLQEAITAFEGQVAAHGRHVRESLESLATRTDQNLAQLQKTTAAVAPKVDLAAVEQALAAVQRELASLSGAVRQPTAERAVAASPQASSPASMPAVSERLAASPPDAMPSSGVAQTIAGTRAAPGGNVLGAIARLKKMRG